MDIELLRKTCLGFKGATEDIKWGSDLCFCVGKKMFCVTGVAQPRLTASLKVLPEEFNELTERAGIVPAKYVARYKWIFVEDKSALSAKEWKHFVRQSYELVRDKLPKKIRDSL